jgi:hypothetical protein
MNTNRHAAALKALNTTAHQEYGDTGGGAVGVLTLVNLDRHAIALKALNTTAQGNALGTRIG